MDDWELKYADDRADPIIVDLVRVTRRGWLNFGPDVLTDLPRRFFVESTTRVTAEAIRGVLLKYVISSSASTLGAARFDEWDEDSRFAYTLLGLHTDTRSVAGVQARRLRALNELRASFATTPQAVQKRPWKDQPMGGPEWRMLVRMRDAIRADWADPPSPVPTTSIPAPVDSFQGREEELEVVSRILREARIVTLVGGGGVGKTRLALELARNLEEPSAFAPLFIRLEDTRPADDVGEAVARQLGLRREGKETWTERLVDVCSSPGTLLILDNCEHVLDACASLVARLIAECPELRVLATSRHPLQVRGEAVERLGGLPVDDNTNKTVGPAVRLFLDRARAQSHALSVDAGTRDEISALVTALGGVPLAIEIAAGRTRTLSVSEITSMIGSHIDRLESVASDSPKRHLTIQASLDWSYALLSHNEQRAFRLASILPSGWTRRGMEAFLAGGGGSGPELCDVDELYECSLVERSELGGVSRFSMLDVVRRYGYDRLVALGEESPALRMLVAWCVGFARQANDRFGGEAADSWLPLVDAEYENVRAAMRYAREQDDYASLLRICGLWWYWFLRGYSAEVAPLIEAALSSGAGSDAERARAALAYGTLSWASGNLSTADEWLAHASAAANRVGDEWCASQASHILGHVAHHRGDLEDAYEHYLAARQFWTMRPLTYWHALLQDDVGYVLADLGQDEDAEEALRDALTKAERVNDRQAIGNAKAHLSVILRRRGEYADAAELALDAVTKLRELGYRRGLATALRNLAEVHVLLGEYDDAETSLGEAKAIQQAIGHWAGFSRSLVTESRLSLGRGEPLKAATLLGRARGWRHESRSSITPADRHDEATLEAETLSAGGEDVVRKRLASGARDAADEARWVLQHGS